MDYIAVQGLTLEPQGIVSLGPTAVLTITSLPSTKVKADGSFVYSGEVQFTLVGGDATGYDPGTVVTVAPGVVLPTSIKCLADGSFVIREGDMAPLVSMTGTISGTPTPFVEPWQITDAGQTKVLSN